MVSCHGCLTLSANRVNLTCQVIQVERGKPITPPVRAGKPQGELLELWVWDYGKSEGQPVTGWIGIEQPATSSRTKVSRLPIGL